MGAAYGQLPTEIAALPWVLVRDLFEAMLKRKGREREFALQMAQLGAMGSIGAMVGGVAPPEDGVDSMQVRELAGMGFPVEMRKVE